MAFRSSIAPQFDPLQHITFSWSILRTTKITFPWLPRRWVWKRSNALRVKLMRAWRSRLLMSLTSSRRRNPVQINRRLHNSSLRLLHSLILRGMSPQVIGSNPFHQIATGMCLKTPEEGTPKMGVGFNNSDVLRAEVKLTRLAKAKTS